MKRSIIDWTRRGAALGLLALAGAAEIRPRAAAPVVAEEAPSTHPLDWSPDAVALPAATAVFTLDAATLDRWLAAAQAGEEYEAAARAGRLAPEEAADRLCAVWAEHGFDAAGFRRVEEHTWELLGHLWLEGERSSEIDAGEAALIESRREALEALLR